MAPNHYFKENPFMTCIIDVQSSSRKTVSKVLSKCHGMVHNFRMDGGTIEISGTIDPYTLLKGLARAGNRAELKWLQFGECSSNLFMPGPTGRYLQPAANPHLKPPASHYPQHAAAQTMIHRGYPAQYNHHQNNNYDHYQHQPQRYDHAQHYNNNYYQQHQGNYEQRQEVLDYEDKKKEVDPYERRQEDCCVVM